MTVANITVVDADSLEAAADMLDAWAIDTDAGIFGPVVDDAEIVITDSRDDYGDYLARMAEYLTAEEGDDEDPEPEPPAPAVAVITILPCTECGATGTVRYSTGFALSDWIE